MGELIRKREWLSSLVDALNLANETAETEEEIKLISLLVRTLHENIEFVEND